MDQSDCLYTSSHIIKLTNEELKPIMFSVDVAGSLLLFLPGTETRMLVHIALYI